MATAAQLKAWRDQIDKLEARRMEIELGGVTSVGFGQRVESFRTLDEIEDAISRYRDRIDMHFKNKGGVGMFDVAIQKVQGGAGQEPV